MNRKGAMDVDEVLRKYSKKIDSQVQRYDYSQGNSSNADFSSVSKDYSQFKSDMMPELSRYEKWCRSLGSFVKIRPSAKDSARIDWDLAVAHLDLSSQEVAGLAFFSFMGVFLFAAIVSIAIFFITGKVEDVGLFFLLMIVMAVFLYYYFSTMPARLAIKWKLKASSQMVPAVLYTVIYMKHTSNLERAINFVSQHVEAPLALDFKKILWDLQTGKFSSVKDNNHGYSPPSMSIFKKISL